jgi:2,4'-dihydroxyacetophenone dioxygenase
MAADRLGQPPPQRQFRRPHMPRMKPDPNPRMPNQHPMPKKTLRDLVVRYAVPVNEQIWVPQGENV